jgi:hypothetical protein
MKLLLALERQSVASSTGAEVGIVSWSRLPLKSVNWSHLTSFQ